MIQCEIHKYEIQLLGIQYAMRYSVLRLPGGPSTKSHRQSSRVDWTHLNCK
eukprot:gene10501-3218_t